jgi:hypothetical protein
MTDDHSKKSRAEQNRKAQQVYRRNREEKMKRLEADQAALAQTRIRLAAAEARIEQLALVSYDSFRLSIDLMLTTQDLEAKSIETNALRTSLLTVADNANVSIVTPQNNLVIAPTDWETRDKASVDETGPTRSALALDALARASREVAKANRARRVHPE